MHYYKIYNRLICSEIPIRPLIPTTSPVRNCNISVVLGKTPKGLHQVSVFENVCTQIAPNELLFFHKALGVRIYVENGNKVIIDEDYETDVNKVSLFLLGSIFTAALYMQDSMSLHASAVNTPKGAVLFLGKSGAGKSTLAHGLHQKGYTAITDDVAVINIKDDTAYTYSGYNSFKLWQKSLDFHQKKLGDEKLVRDCYNKYYVDFGSPPQNKAYKIHKIYLIKTHNKKELLIPEIEDINERLKILKNNTYRQNFIKGLRKEIQQFHTITKLAHTPLSTITRPQKLTTSIESYIETIEKDILQ